MGRRGTGVEIRENAIRIQFSDGGQVVLRLNDCQCHPCLVEQGVSALRIDLLSRREWLPCTTTRPGRSVYSRKTCSTSLQPALAKAGVMNLAQMSASDSFFLFDHGLQRPDLSAGSNGHVPLLARRAYRRRVTAGVCPAQQKGRQGLLLAARLLERLCTYRMHLHRPDSRINTGFLVMGWLMGLEPTTTGITILDSTN
jgi:hypothetical protein